MSEIQKSMQSILSGQAKVAGAEIVATARIIQAAEILTQTGFEDEAHLVLSTLKDTPLSKEASAKVEEVKEEVLFEITSDSLDS